MEQLTVYEDWKFDAFPLATIYKDAYIFGDRDNGWLRYFDTSKAPPTPIQFMLLLDR